MSRPAGEPDELRLAEVDVSACSCWLCAGERPNEVDPGDERLFAAVRSVGWHVIGIMESEEGPGWGFTVGLWHTRRRPEIAVFGFPHQACIELLNEVAQERADLPGPTHEDEATLRGNPIRFREMHVGWHRGLLGYMSWFYRAAKGFPPVPVMQLVWADKQRHFPWDPDCHEYVAAAQPHAWLTPAEAPSGSYTAMCLP